jgi:hypothetical protein
MLDHGLVRHVAIDPRQTERRIVRSAVLFGSMSPSEHALQHARYLAERHDACRTPRLKDLVSPLLNPWQIEKVRRRIAMLRRETSPLKRQAHRQAITDHDDEHFFLSVSEFNTEQHRNIRPSPVQLPLRYQSLHHFTNP